MAKSGRYLRTERNTRKRVLELEEYCRTYDEWPRNYRFKTGKKEKQGRSLYLWLYNNNYKYQENTFRYGDVELHCGMSTGKYLDYLFSKYAKNIPGTIIHERAMVDKILDYINTYGEFPRNYYPISETSTEQERISSKLYSWLQEYKYFSKSEFILKDEMYDENRTIGRVLFDAQINARNYSNKSATYVISKVRELEEFCRTHKVWPKQLSKDKQEVMFYTWLDHSKYHYDRDDFLYIDYKDENGVSIKDRIDKLFLEYGHTNQMTELYKDRRIEEIQKYALKHNDFPKAKPKGIVMDADLSRVLNGFVSYSNALKPNKDFLYPGVTKNGLDREELIKAYYAIFVYKKQLDMGNLNILNRSHAKRSKNIGLVLYYYFGGYLKAMLTNDTETMFNLVNIINNYAMRKTIKVDIDGIIASFNMNLKEALIYHFNKYTEYSIQNNNDLALLHKCLYEYTKYVGLHLEHNKDADLSDSKYLFR